MKNHGLIGDEQKVKSFASRWMSKEKSEINKDNNNSDELSGNEAVLEHGVIISVVINTGKGREKKELIKLYRVLEVHDKFYNKYFFRDNSCGKAVGRRNFPARKFWLSARMVKKDVTYMRMSVLHQMNTNIILYVE